MEVVAKEALWGKWVAQNLPYQWPRMSPRQTSCREWAQATFLRLGGFGAAAQSSRDWMGAQVLQSRGAKMRPGAQDPLPKVPTVPYG